MSQKTAVKLLISRDRRCRASLAFLPDPELLVVAIFMVKVHGPTDGEVTVSELS